MKFGGMVKVRQELGYVDINLAVGKYRSEIVLQVNADGLDFENEIESILVERFGEPFVHIQKRVGGQRNRLDFYVYSKSKNFAVDVTFVTGTYRNLQTNINVKISKYNDRVSEMYIVVSGDFSQANLDELAFRKKIPLPMNWKLLTPQTFINLVSGYKPHNLK